MHCLLFKIGCAVHTNKLRRITYCRHKGNSSNYIFIWDVSFSSEWMDGDVLVFSGSTPGSVWVQVGLNKQMELLWLCQVLLHFLLTVSAIHGWIFSRRQNVMAALCFDKSECSWLLQYVWVTKEQTLIISPAQRGSGRASASIRGCWLFVKPLMCLITSHIQEHYFLSSFFSSSSSTSVLKSKGEAGPDLTYYCCTSVEGEEAETGEEWPLC